jgi:hypothetical protein
MEAHSLPSAPAALSRPARAVTEPAVHAHRLLVARRQRLHATPRGGGAHSGRERSL